jgi:hypothetical protein
MYSFKTKTITYLLYTVILFFFSACSRPAAKYVYPDYQKPDEIAVLPTLYDGSDSTASTIFRQILFEELHQKKYCRLLDPSEIDARLAQSGIDYADYSQLFHLEKLFRLLDVDGLLYSQILYLNFSVTEECVKANFKLFTPISYMVWEDEREVKRKQSSGSSFTDIVAAVIVDILVTPFLRAASRAIGDHELKPEMEKCIRTSLKTLP